MSSNNRSDNHDHLAADSSPVILPRQSSPIVRGELTDAITPVAEVRIPTLEACSLAGTERSLRLAWAWLGSPR